MKSIYMFEFVKQLTWSPRRWYLHGAQIVGRVVAARRADEIEEQTVETQLKQMRDEIFLLLFGRATVEYQLDVGVRVLEQVARQREDLEQLGVAERARDFAMSRQRPIHLDLVHVVYLDD